jgi:hypothetical protein
MVASTSDQSVSFLNYFIYAGLLYDIFTSFISAGLLVPEEAVISEMKKVYENYNHNIEQIARDVEIFSFNAMNDPSVKAQLYYNFTKDFFTQYIQTTN